MDALIVLGFLGFIAWRERQHAVELRAVASRRGGGAVPVPVAPARRRRDKPEKPRVISAEDDAAWNEAHGFSEPDEGEGES